MTLDGVVHDPLLFSRPREPRTEPVDLAALIDHTIELPPRSVTIRLRLAGSAPRASHSELVAGGAAYSGPSMAGRPPGKTRRGAN
jgi:hypothetical protein